MIALATLPATHRAAIDHLVVTTSLIGCTEYAHGGLIATRPLIVGQQLLWKWARSLVDVDSCPPSLKDCQEHLSAEDRDAILGALAIAWGRSVPVQRGGAA